MFFLKWEGMVLGRDFYIGTVEVQKLVFRLAGRVTTTGGEEERMLEV